jgi:uncharacterized cupin superfamily protein
MNMMTPPAASFQEVVRSFVDLRAFAAAPEAGITTPETGDLWLSSRRLLPVPEGEVAISALSLDGGSGSVQALAADEFVLVLEGELSISTTATTKLAPSRSAVLPAGLSFDWAAKPGTIAIVMRCNGDAAGARDIVEVDFDGERTPSSPPAPDVLLTETPACRNHTDYLSQTGEFKVGTWESTPYHRSAIDYVHYELMLLLDGEVEFEDAFSGETRTFREGDVFVMIQGARCSWKHTGFCAKQYAIYRPN